MHTRKYKGINISGFFFIVFGTLLITSSFNNTLHLKTIGLLSIGLLLYSTILLLILLTSKTGLIPKIFVPLLFSMGLFIIIYTMSLIINSFNVHGIASLLKIASIFSFFYCLLLIKVKLSDIYKLNIILSVYILLLFIFWLCTGTKYPFQGFMLNPNSLGGQIFCLIFFLLVILYYSKGIYKHIFTLPLICSLILVYNTASRAAILSLMIVLLTYVLLRLFYINRLTYNLFFVIYNLIVIAFVYVYITISKSDFANVLNKFIFQYTGKNLFSGRQYIWSNVLEKMLEKPLFGFGPGISLTDITNGLSVHNLYLQIGLQTGFIGLISLFCMFLAIWNLLWRVKDNFLGKLTISYFVGILFYQVLEVTLLENNLSIGLFQWTILGLGISNILYENKNKIG